MHPEIGKLAGQAKLSRFFNWNIRFGAFRRVWTFMSKIQKFRREIEGLVEERVA